MNLERTHLDAMVMTHICMLAVVNRSDGQAKHVRWDRTNCINLGVYDCAYFRGFGFLWRFITANVEGYEQWPTLRMN